MVKFVLDLFTNLMAAIIRVTKEFSFEMAHALLHYDGPCRNIHGHSYRLFVTISGMPVSDPENPKNGMVIDFFVLKNIVSKEIINVFDHAIAISSEDDNDKIAIFRGMFGNTVVVDYQPTCENLVTDFAERIKRRLPDRVKLHSLKLYETATSYAEWYASDNE